MCQFSKLTFLFEIPQCDSSKEINPNANIWKALGISNGDISMIE
jgi:hypothetical protein